MILEILKYTHKNKTIKQVTLVRCIGHYITVDAVGLTNGTIGISLGLPMVPLVPTFLPMVTLAPMVPLADEKRSGFSGYQ